MSVPVPVSCLLSYISCLLSQVACITSPVSCILSHNQLCNVSHLLDLTPFYCLLYLFSCLLSHISCLLSHISCLTSPFSCLLSHISCLMSPVARLLSPVSRLLSPVSCLLSYISRPLSSYMRMQAAFYNALTNFLLEKAQKHLSKKIIILRNSVCNCCNMSIVAVLWIRNDLFQIRIQLQIFWVLDPDPGKSSRSMRIRIQAILFKQCCRAKIIYFRLQLRLWP